MKVYTKTDIGAKRTENQDRVWSGNLIDDAVAIIVCDGMGGENAGSCASQTTVDFIAERIEKGFRVGINRNSIRNLLITSVTAANSIVYDKANADESKTGMGTTCVAAIIHKETAYIINVGDSRAYHIFDDEKENAVNIQQITKDHTYIRGLIDKGKLTEEESKTHPKKNCITRAVGAESDITPDYFEMEMLPSSVLLLCTDGLHAYGDDVEIAEIIANNPLSRVCDLLVEYALGNGGRDNITVAVASAQH